MMSSTSRWPQKGTLEMTAIGEGVGRQRLSRAIVVCSRAGLAGGVTIGAVAEGGETRGPGAVIGSPVAIAAAVT